MAATNPAVEAAAAAIKPPAHQNPVVLEALRILAVAAIEAVVNHKTTAHPHHVEVSVAVAGAQLKALVTVTQAARRVAKRCARRARRTRAAPARRTATTTSASRAAVCFPANRATIRAVAVVANQDPPAVVHRQGIINYDRQGR